MFAKEEFSNLLEINLELEPDAASLFDSKKPAVILELLRARYAVAIEPGDTLLFLDEVQAAPQLLAALRYFYEELPQLHVIAAGSLLDFTLADHEYSMPVGRIQYLHLGPMRFEEFLLALGKAELHAFLTGFETGQQVPDAIHNELMRRCNQFMIVGGMPASVAAFVREEEHADSEAKKQSILSTYREDFSKYGTRADRPRLEKLLAAIPRFVGQKFMYSRVDRSDRSRELKSALDLLLRAGVCSRTRHTAANGIPLGAEVNSRDFKILFMDVGLLCRSLGLNMLDLEEVPDRALVNSGALAEQFVGQHLLYSGETFAEPETFCWMRQKAQSSAEVDYVISLGQNIVPVEVKAGTTGRLKSLHVFLQRKGRDFGVRFSTDKPSLMDATTSIARAEPMPFRLLSLPLYMVGQTHRLARNSLRG